MPLLQKQYLYHKEQVKYKSLTRPPPLSEHSGTVSENKQILRFQVRIPLQTVANFTNCLIYVYNHKSNGRGPTCPINILARQLCSKFIAYELAPLLEVCNKFADTAIPNLLQICRFDILSLAQTCCKFTAISGSIQY